MSHMDFTDVFHFVTISFELVGVGTLSAGLVVSVVVSGIVWKQTRSAKEGFHALRTIFGGVILLGLELLVAADIVATVTSHPSLEDALILGLIVVIRTVLSFSLQIEMDGVAPWRRAFVTGPEVMSHAYQAAAHPQNSPTHNDQQQNIQPNSSAASS